jgi:tetratricopeptide (TPR) repeat protein
MFMMAATISEMKTKKKNEGFLREVAMLQLLLRDIPEFHKVSHSVLDSDGGAKLRGTWHTCALANHLAGYPSVALQMLHIWRSTEADQRKEQSAKAAKAARELATKRKEDPETAVAAAVAKTMWEPNADDQDSALFRVEVLAETGQFAEALAALDEECASGSVLSAEEADQYRASLSLWTGDVETAKIAFSRLAHRHPEDVTYVAGLILCELGGLPLELSPVNPSVNSVPGVPVARGSAVGSWRVPRMERGSWIQFPLAPIGSKAIPVFPSYLSSEQAERALAIVDGLAAEFPKSYALRTLPLLIVPGTHDRFRATLDALLRDSIRNGKESCISVLEPLYATAELNADSEASPQFLSAAADPKVRVMGELLKGYAGPCMELARSEACGKGPVFPAPAAGAKPLTHEPLDRLEQVSVVPVSMELWAEHLLRVGLFSEALEVLDLAIRHTPTFPSLYVAKARALGAMGAWKEAADVADQGRVLDLADRATSIVACECMLRAGQIDRAMDAAKVFARPEGDAMAYFKSMFTFWLSLGSARAFEETGDVGRALRRYDWLSSQSKSMDADTHDFLGYCLRMARMRSALRLVRWCEFAPTLDVFAEAQAGLVRCWLRLADHSSLRTDEFGAAHVSETEFAAMSPDEQRAVREAQKQAKKARAEEARARSAVEALGKFPEDAWPEADPTGAALTSDAEPLAKAEEVAFTMLRAVERATKRASGGETDSSGLPVACRRATVLAASCGMDVALRRNKPILALRALAASKPLVSPAPGVEPVPSPGIDGSLLWEPEVAPLAARLLRMGRDATKREEWGPIVCQVLDSAFADDAWGLSVDAPASSSRAASSLAARFAEAFIAKRASKSMWDRVACFRVALEAHGTAPPRAAVELLLDTSSGVVTPDAVAAAKEELDRWDLDDDMAALSRAAHAAFPKADSFVASI